MKRKRTSVFCVLALLAVLLPVPARADKSCVCGYNSKVILRKCHEKEEYFFFVCSEKVRSVQAPLREERRSLWSRAADLC